MRPTPALLLKLCAATVVGLFLAYSTDAMAANCPKSLANTPYCDKFIVYKPPGSPVDKRIKAYIRNDSSDLDVRSFAFLVSVSQYPSFSDPNERVLKSVQSDLPNITEFLKTQDFDEVIVLKDEEATKDAINFFLEQYFLPQVTDYHRRARFLFMYDGHGAEGQSQNDAGALALALTTGDADMDPSHSYSLDDLQSRLRKISNQAYHTLALIGSCYSGGIFPIITSKGANFSYPREPGSHAVTAAKAHELARGAPDGKGTVFFEELLNAINKSAIDPNGAQFISAQAGPPQKVLGTTIVRLGQVVEAMDMALEDLEIPDTNPTEYGPQLRVGSLVSDDSFNGAFFFLAPVEAEKQASTKGDELPPQELDFQTTGSAIIGQPSVKVFSLPEDYLIRGADFSSFDGIPDIDAAAKSGMLKFLYERASVGSDQRDDRFSRYRADANKAELPFGAIHVFDCSPAESQIKNLLDVAPPDKALLPVAIDLEWYKVTGSPTLDACATDRDGVRANLKDLLGRVQEAYGKQPLIYASRQGIGDVLQSDFSQYPLWYAERTHDDAPGYPGDNPWTIWQITKQGKIDGFEKPIDYNVFFGNQAQFTAFAATGQNAGREAAISPEKK
ncbi:GH25 family lysozyme [Rhizobium sp. BK418]|uniref:glycoside hydrolase family 25 protein n=1 Tax=Rhizobium sp. BK418 TaxID=2512120 RepID=UPI0010453052|nr:GH25 family lysozyme [Rhizobium sp. BK418]TCR98812.1 lysozyme [Rhizobium sp. BK418]